MERGGNKGENRVEVKERAKLEGLLKSAGQSAHLSDMKTFSVYRFHESRLYFNLRTKECNGTLLMGLSTGTNSDAQAVTDRIIDLRVFDHYNYQNKTGLSLLSENFKTKLTIFTIR